MKKILFVFAALLVALSVSAESYTNLWKQVKEAQKKDLPKTEIDILRQIVDKATQEKQYGHLMKAQILCLAVENTVSPDSIKKNIAFVEKKYNETKEPVLKAVYAAVLGKINMELTPDDPKTYYQKSQNWYAKALSNPALLARQKSVDYEPALEPGVDSRIFYGDLLHVIGIEAEDYKTLYNYYSKTDNRTAACICALKQMQRSKPYRGLTKKERTQYLLRLDSLLKKYGDLREAGEIAIEYYNVYASSDDAKPETLVSYINYALANWGTWPRMNILRNKLSDLQQPSFTINVGDYMMLPDVPRRLAINSIRNIQELYINVYKVNIDGNTQLNPGNSKDYAKMQKLISSTPSFSTTRRYIGQPAWKENTDTVSIDGLPVGVYVLEVTTNNNFIKPQRELLRVSNLYVMHEALANNNIRYVVVNATTGAPVPGAHLQLTLYKNNNSKTSNYTADKNGEVIYKKDEKHRLMVWAYTNDDRSCGVFSGNSFYSYWNDDDNKEQERNVKVYTDRSIYRPGQTVHASTLIWLANNKTFTSKAEAGVQVKFYLYSPNKTLEIKSATTDNYGTASVDFVLPTHGETGNYHIYTETPIRTSTAYFHVEEYKRPTFDVTFDKYKEAYKSGDTISVKGVAKTYSGMPVQNAKVITTINRSEGKWWWSHGNTQVAKPDTVYTADDGSFTVKVPMLYPENVNLSKAVYYNFDINAKVTDAGGETREGSITLPLSNRTATLSSDLPGKVLRDSLRNLTFSYQNLIGENIEGKVNYRFDDGQWKAVDAHKTIAISPRLSSGQHKLEAICGNDTLKQEVVVFSYSDKVPAVNTNDWFYISGNKFPSDGSPVYLQVGSSAPSTQVYWTVCSGNKVIESGTHKLGNEVLTKKIQYNKEFGDGITISQAWVVRGKLYRHTVDISRPLPNDKLKLTWKTFRDKLTPGQKETWTLNVTSPTGKPARAQLLTAMYDKSLDAIYSHSWNFSNNYYVNLPSFQWSGGSNSTIGLYGFQDFKPLSERSLSFTHFNKDMFKGWMHWIVSYVGAVESRSSSKKDNDLVYAKENVRKEKAAPMALAATNMMLRSPDELMDSNVPIGAGLVTEEPSGNSGAAQLRENLNETAFFYPNLMTDSKGNVDITFTLPESVTTWKLMGLAHDSLMNYGLITSEAVASKAVMVQPNMPRFLREGDQGTITARIFNTTDKRQSGIARLVIVDPETERTLMEKRLTFAVQPNGTVTPAFKVDAARLAEKSDGQTLLVARIYAEGNGFSDGEQHYLPLLPDKESVVNTIPFYQNEPGKKTIDLSNLFPADSKDKKLTVEYVNNPTWLVLQALPTMANPTEEDAMSLAAAVYANAIGQSIIKSSPRIAQVMKLWQQEMDGNSLTSSLEKDEDLKTIVLNETPWLAEANDETDQKRQLINFLDESTISYHISNFIGKLQKLQNGDGSFSWWPSMPGNKYMTLSVVETLTRLNNMVGTQNDTRDMLSRAFKYLDSEMAKEVAQLKKDEKKGVKNLMPSEMACHWLYASALAGRNKTADITYIANLLDKAPTSLTIYGKAGMAVILAQYGYTKHAKEYLQSIREYSVYKEETGRYFDTDKARYSWFDYKIPTQTFAIEALQRLTPTDTVTISEMQRWLIHEKRTTCWSTTINSVDAVYALLGNNISGTYSVKSLGNADNSTLSLDGEQLHLPKATAGIGYVKVAKEVNAPKELTIDKTSTGTSWGAVYGQFLQKASNVASTASGLKVTRQIVASDNVSPTGGNKSEVKGNHKPQSSNLNPQTLKVGDKVKVRITITADRDYDFVQVQDKRAACMEPVRQLSGYQWSKDFAYYFAPKDNVSNYYIYKLAKGKHVIEAEYYIDREGDYSTGICTVQCAYSPEFSGREAAKTLNIK